MHDLRPAAGQSGEIRGDLGDPEALGQGLRGRHVGIADADQLDEIEPLQRGQMMAGDVAGNGSDAQLPRDVACSWLSRNSGRGWIGELDRHAFDDILDGPVWSAAAAIVRQCSRA
jgi:hypothetical protein